MTVKETSLPKSKANGAAGFVLGLAIVVALAFLAHWIKTQVYAAQLPFGIPGKALEYPLWAAMVGLLANGALKTMGVYQRVKSGFRTELFLKIGLVLLGAGTSFTLIVKAGIGGVIQGLVLVTSVFLFSWWLAGKFEIPSRLRAVMSAAVSICGVSAAIAAAGAVLARKEETTYVTTLVILTALPLMVLMPIMAGWMGLSEAVAGAWFGGNVDTTAAVVGAGTIYGETAQQVATIVKSAQNALIGVVAFLLALYFTTTVDKKETKPSPAIIWQRFPKFVLGFLAASLLASIGVIAAGSDPAKAIAAMKDWAFCLAFVSMGLDLAVGDIRKMGSAPVSVYLIVTVFNTVLALLAAWVIFGMLFPVSF
jgi:uncharacterized membrane protein YadS